MAKCEAFDVTTIKANAVEVKKSFFRLPNPRKSAKDRKTFYCRGKQSQTRTVTQPEYISATLQDLELPSLQDRRCDFRLALVYRMVKGTLPSVPADDFITQQRTNKRHTQSRRFTDCVSSNIVERSATKNTKCCLNTDQFKNSFFVPTIAYLSHHNDQQIETET